MKPILCSLLVAALAVGLAAWSGAAASAAADPVAGNARSKVRVVVYQDLECPDCARWHGIFEQQLIPHFGARVGFEFRDFPLSQHLWSFNAAVLARYFDSVKPAVGMAWRDYCFTHQTELTPDNLLDRAVRWAAPYGVARPQLEGVFGRGDLFALVQRDQRLGRQDHVQHTPTILLNGVEATTPTELEQRLEAALRG